MPMKSTLDIINESKKSLGDDNQLRRELANERYVGVADWDNDSTLPPRVVRHIKLDNVVDYIDLEYHSDSEDDYDDATNVTINIESLLLDDSIGAITTGLRKKGLGLMDIELVYDEWEVYGKVTFMFLAIYQLLLADEYRESDHIPTIIRVPDCVVTESDGMLRINGAGDIPLDIEYDIIDGPVTSEIQSYYSLHNITAQSVRNRFLCHGTIKVIVMWYPELNSELLPDTIEIKVTGGTASVLAADQWFVSTLWGHRVIIIPAIDLSISGMEELIYRMKQQNVYGEGIKTARPRYSGTYLSVNPQFGGNSPSHISTHVIMVSESD